nr:Na/Pi cotransporter family protein [uncultured Desulfobulbus sp.]
MNTALPFSTIAVTFIGGLAMFLYGISTMSDGMKKLSGERIRTLMTALTANRFSGLFVGAFATMVVQSSSAIMVMLVSLVQAQMVTYTQVVGVILGAEIGTTFTAQLIAFKLEDYALLLFAFGLFLKLLGRTAGMRQWGEAIAGFGLLFFGMQLMSEAMAPLRSYPPLLSLLHQLENPLISVAVGLCVTAVIQSSSAFVGIIIVLAQQNSLSLEASIPLMFGSNIGTCITGAIASIGTFRAARRVSLAQILINACSVLFFLFWIPEAVQLVRMLSPGADLPRQIANAHTLYNVLMALFFLPLLPAVSRLVLLLLPDNPEEQRLIPAVWYLRSSALQPPSMALGLVRAEMARMNTILGRMLEGVIPSLTGEAPACDSIFPKLSPVQAIHMRENKIDFLESRVTEFLFKAVEQQLSERESKEAFALMEIVKIQEAIGDVIEVKLLGLLVQKKALKLDLTEEGKKEIVGLHTHILKENELLTNALREMDAQQAASLLGEEDHFFRLERDVEFRHMERVVHKVPASRHTHALHMEIMDGLRQIHEYNAAIARTIHALSPEQSSV